MAPKLQKYKLVKPFNSIHWLGKEWTQSTITDEVAEALSKRKNFVDYFAPVGKSKNPPATETTEENQ
jgi:hypothetical protein